MSSTHRTCSVEGCEKRHYARGWCHMHYQRWRKHGGLLREPPALPARFWSKVDDRDDDGCWPWTAGKQHQGYGMFSCAGRQVPAHRIAYELTVGPIPDGHDVHHRCENKACCNPGHLECLLRKQHAERHYPLHLPEQCTDGPPVCAKHPPEAERRRPSGRRYCAVCNRERVAAWKARQPVRTW